jgi:hypothetical protein
MTLDEKRKRDIKPESVHKTKFCPHLTHMVRVGDLISLEKSKCDGQECNFWSRTGGPDDDPSGICTW